MFSPERLSFSPAGRDEEPHRTTQESMFNYNPPQRRGPRRTKAPAARSTSIASIAERVFCKGEGEPINRNSNGSPLLR